MKTDVKNPTGLTRLPIEYTIGREYRYPNSRKRFKLTWVNDWAFHFECGKWVTDNVFSDLIDCRTGLASWQITQTKLEL